MQTVRIQTAQNVFIEYQPASVGDRILAALIDQIITWSYFIAIIGGISQVNARENVSWVMYFVLLLPFLFYDLICEIFMDGRTIGKKAMNVKVARLDGSQPSVSNYLLRWLIRPLDVSFCWGALAIVSVSASGKGQRVGDLAAGTTVIRTKRKVGLYDMLLPEVQDDYAPTFPQVMALSDRDVAIIKEALSAYHNYESRESWLLETLTEKVKSLIGVQSTLTNLSFLQTVLKDHAYLTSHGV